MKTKKKRGRPPKHKTSETTGMTYDGAINYALDKEVKSELDKSLANKDESPLTDDERKYLETKKENKACTLNIRFTESELQDIKDKCRQFGYRSKSTYIRDCVRASNSRSVTGSTERESSLNRKRKIHLNKERNII